GRCRAPYPDLVVHDVDPPAGGEPDQLRAHQPVADRVCPPKPAPAGIERQQQQILAEPVHATHSTSPIQAAAALTGNGPLDAPTSLAQDSRMGARAATQTAGTSSPSQRFATPGHAGRSGVPTIRAQRWPAR